jgi:hypothetical protein
MFMKKLIILILLIVFALLLLIVAGWLIMTKVNTNFATEALLEFHYDSVPGGHNPNANITDAITDESDISTLKEILSGRSFKDSFACGFTTNISITMTNGKKSIMFCPANDGCPIIRIGDSNSYVCITESQRESLDRILEKYGMFFPCV